MECVASVLLTFVVGHVPQRRVTGVPLALALVEASFNPALYRKERQSCDADMATSQRESEQTVLWSKEQDLVFFSVINSRSFNLTWIIRLFKRHKFPHRSEFSFRSSSSRIKVKAVFT